MQTIFEFRVPEMYANALFHQTEGIRLGDTVRKISLYGDDPRLPQVGELDKLIRAQASEPPRYFFSGWSVQRRYTQQELLAAEILQLYPTYIIDTSGELCGTKYDESVACPQCGGGARQISGLRLDLRKLPKIKDIARTTAGEVIVSQRLAELLVDSDAKGVELGLVQHNAIYEDDPFDLNNAFIGRDILKAAANAGCPHPTGRFWIWLNRIENRDVYKRAIQEYVDSKSGSKSPTQRLVPAWHQLIFTSAVDVVPPTSAGIDPFDADNNGETYCLRGDTIGLNQLTELSVSRAMFLECDLDVVYTKQRFGVRRGLLRPESAIVISPRMWRLLEQSKMKGLRYEVAYLR